MTFSLRVDKLGKQYRLGGGRPVGDTFYDLLAGALKVRGRGRAAAEESYANLFWALRDVSFELAPGEVLGVIGRNGAGKSTLLKLLTRITEPSQGRIEIHGRVASLLEVGTGFHPELSGRENIYLNGAILGMTRQEIARKFDEIVAFAEVEKFLDTPVKRYSSGMYVRLAFAVAAHLEPDVLVVDEVLAVGDASFQKKCLAKLGEVGGVGRTVLLVSHNLSAIQAHCTKAIWLDAGSLRLSGNPESAVRAYVASSSTEGTHRTWANLESAPGNDRVRIRSVAVKGSGDRDAGLTLDSEIRLSFEYWNLVEGAPLCLSLHVVDDAGQIAFNAFPWREQSWHGRPFRQGLYRSECVIPARLLSDRTYTVDLFVMRDQREVILRLPQALVFRVGDVPEPNCGWLGGWPGSVRPFLSWTTELLSESFESTELS